MNNSAVKTKRTIISAIIAVTQSKWMRQALTALALVTTGYKPHH
ncbi:hypothetical protein BH11VER1_BH11VER1_01280 [soil metagenome]